MSPQSTQALTCRILDMNFAEWALQHHLARPWASLAVERGRERYGHDGWGRRIGGRRVLEGFG